MASFYRHSTQVAHALLENLCRAKIPKVLYYRFLTILIRESYGRKNQKGRNGKYIEWEPSVFTKNGIAQSKVSDAKKELLSLRIIRPYYTTGIGINKNTSQWKVEWYEKPVEFPQQGSVPSAGKGKSSLSKEVEFPQQGSGVPSAGKSTGARCSNDQYLQRLKKGKKGKILYTDEFEELWKKYPKGKGKKDGMKAYANHVIRHSNVTHDLLVTILDKALPEMERKIKADGSDQFIKQCSSWINSMPWEDEPSQTESKPKTAAQQQPTELQLFEDWLLDLEHTKQIMPMQYREVHDYYHTLLDLDFKERRDLVNKLVSKLIKQNKEKTNEA